MDEKPVSECHATSQEPGPCREAGEEPLAKQPFPFGDQMEQLARLAEPLLTLRAAELVRGHGTQEAMAGGAGVAILDQLPALGQGRKLATQPGQHPPDRVVVQSPFVDGDLAGRRLIASDRASRTGRLTVGLLVALQVAGGEFQQRRAGVTLIGEYESRGNR